MSFHVHIRLFASISLYTAVPIVFPDIHVVQPLTVVVALRVTCSFCLARWPRLRVARLWCGRAEVWFGMVGAVCIGVMVRDIVVCVEET